MRGHNVTYLYFVHDGISLARLTFSPSPPAGLILHTVREFRFYILLTVDKIMFSLSRQVMKRGGKPEGIKEKVTFPLFRQDV